MTPLTAEQFLENEGYFDNPHFPFDHVATLMQRYANYQAALSTAQPATGMKEPIRASEQIPPVGIYHAFYNGDHVLFQVHDGGFRTINYHGDKDDAPRLNLIKWLDESQPYDKEAADEHASFNMGLYRPQKVAVWNQRLKGIREAPVFCDKQSDCQYPNCGCEYGVGKEQKNTQK